MRKQSKSQVFRITGARQGLDEDVRGRQRRYVISMSVRTVSVILAATLWNVERHVAIVALVLGILLPYISVVIANAGRENTPSLPSTFVNVPGPAMIAPPRRTPRGIRPGGRRDRPGVRAGRRPAPSGPSPTRPSPDHGGSAENGIRSRTKLKKSSDQSCCSRCRAAG